MCTQTREQGTEECPRNETEKKKSTGYVWETHAKETISPREEGGGLSWSTSAVNLSW